MSPKGLSKVTPRVLRGHLGTRRTLGHSATQGTWHLGTGVLEARGHSKGTWALGHLDTWVLKALGHLRACSSLPTLINVFGMGNILDDVELHIMYFLYVIDQIYMLIS